MFSSVNNSQTKKVELGMIKHRDVTCIQNTFIKKLIAYSLFLNLHFGPVRLNCTVSYLFADIKEETRFETNTVDPLLFFNYNTTNLAYGFVANIAAAVLFGSSYVPIKRIDTGDGEQTAHLFLS